MLNLWVVIITATNLWLVAQITWASLSLSKFDEIYFSAKFVII